MQHFQISKISKFANFSKITIFKYYNHSRVFQLFKIYKTANFECSKLPQFQQLVFSNFTKLPPFQNFNVPKLQNANVRNLEISQFATLQTHRHFHFSKFTKWRIYQNAIFQTLEKCSCFQIANCLCFQNGKLFQSCFDPNLNPIIKNMFTFNFETTYNINNQIHVVGHTG